VDAVFARSGASAPLLGALRSGHRALDLGDVRDRRRQSYQAHGRSLGDPASRCPTARDAEEPAVSYGIAPANQRAPAPIDSKTTGCRANRFHCMTGDSEEIERCRDRASREVTSGAHGARNNDENRATRSTPEATHVKRERPGNIVDGVTKLASPDAVTHHHQPLPSRPSRGATLTTTRWPRRLDRGRSLRPRVDGNLAMDDALVAPLHRLFRSDDEGAPPRTPSSAYFVTRDRSLRSFEQPTYPASSRSAQSSPTMATTSCVSPSHHPACAKLPVITSSEVRRNTQQATRFAVLKVH
jgi:hypothetical protein